MPEVYDVEEYENGAVYLKISHFKNPLHNTYWLQVGAVGLFLREPEWDKLCELINAYHMETFNLLHRKKQNPLGGVLVWLKTTLWR